MITSAVTIRRPQASDHPFDPVLSAADVERVLTLAPFNQIDASSLPTNALRQILRNHSRIRCYRRGDCVIRKGDYGGSAFLVLSGQVRVVLGPRIAEQRPDADKAGRKRWEAISQIWKQPFFVGPDAPFTFAALALVSYDEARIEPASLSDGSATSDEQPLAQLGPGALFGEIGALSRAPRPAWVFAEDEAELLEIRWQGLRDLRRQVEELRAQIDRLYRERCLKLHLRESPMFHHLNDEEIASIADQTLFETYGDPHWHRSHKAGQDAAKRLESEPVIAQEGHYVDGLIMIRTGFARVSIQLGQNHRTLSYLKPGDIFGLEEIVGNWRAGERLSLRHSLRAIGYVEILRVPTAIIEDRVLPHCSTGSLPGLMATPGATQGAGLPTGNPPTLERDLIVKLVENRLVNGKAAMVIDLNRCVGCDDCVRACAATHDQIPRFVRQGKRLGHYLVANACMHCTDPVCTIDCPTGAIHREPVQGQVEINAATCIGCASCANSCPYGNISMVELRDAAGRPVLDRDSYAPIRKASKCDLCLEHLGAPACERACPYDAIERIDLGDIASLAKCFQR